MGYKINDAEGFVTYEDETPVNVVRWRVTLTEFVQKIGENPTFVADNSHPPFNYRVNGNLWTSVTVTEENNTTEAKSEKKTRRRKKVEA